VRTVGAFEAKTHFSQLIDEMCKSGEPIVVQRRGTSVAVIEPFEPRARESRDRHAARVLEAFAEIRSGQSQRPNESIKDLVEEGRH